MAQVKTFQCDVCEKLKEKTNHWWVVYLTSDTALHIAAWHMADRLQGMLLNSNFPKITEEFHLCGLEHLQQKISELTTARSK